jgi:FkbM family methyltransferase
MTPTRTVGEAHRFRSGSWMERLVDRLRRGRSAPAAPFLKQLYESLLDRWPGDHLVSTMPGGERVRLSSRYRALSWNPQEYEAFRAAVRPGATVLDVGANVGAYTLMFATWAGPDGRVFAFEPAPDARAGLATHLALNQLADRVEVIDAAISADVGRARFAVHPSGGGSSLAIDSLEDPAIVNVATDSIDHFCETRGLRPSLIKIDVEGAELDVLKGARRTLAQPGVETFVEFHPTVWAVSGIGRADLERELEAQGYVAEPLHPTFDPWSMEGVAVRLRRPTDR